VRRRLNDFAVRVNVYYHGRIGFTSPARARDRHPCHSCASTVTAKQADGRFGCWYHFGPLQLAVLS
jgi:hypothetical protein